MLPRILITVAFSLTLAAPTLAHHFRYTANLRGGTQIPANASPGLGHVVITIDFDENIMEIESEFAGLLGTVTEAHIHAPTAAVGVGFADAATQVPTLEDFPVGVTSGSYDKDDFNLALASTYNPAFIASSGGTISTAYVALGNALNAGKAYFNIHTTAFPNGEIRGFLSNVPGDYNDNGVVDAADYVVWRKTFNTTGEGLKADSDNSNMIDNADYAAWRQNFGRAGLSNGAGSGALAGAQVPEPASFMLLIAATAAIFGVRNRG